MWYVGKMKAFIQNISKLGGLNQRSFDFKFFPAE